MSRMQMRHLYLPTWSKRIEASETLLQFVGQFDRDVRRLYCNMVRKLLTLTCVGKLLHLRNCIWPQVTKKYGSRKQKEIHNS